MIIDLHVSTIPLAGEHERYTVATIELCRLAIHLIKPYTCTSTVDGLPCMWAMNSD